jgi:flagellar basal-body rod protein FlgC
MDGILSHTDISASGLTAERLRMEVIANNIANANTTRGQDGGPYRRHEVIFATAYDDAVGAISGGPGAGVRAAVVQTDGGDLPRVYKPGHPDADEQGYVTMPNVSLANEMVDLITANRSYEANLRALRSFRDMAQQALSLLQRI